MIFTQAADIQQLAYFFCQGFYNSMDSGHLGFITSD